MEPATRVDRPRYNPKMPRCECTTVGLGIQRKMDGAGATRRGRADRSWQSDLLHCPFRTVPDTRIPANQHSQRERVDEVLRPRLEFAKRGGGQEEGERTAWFRRLPGQVGAGSSHTRSGIGSSAEAAEEKVKSSNVVSRRGCWHSLTHICDATSANPGSLGVSCSSEPTASTAPATPPASRFFHTLPRSRYKWIGTRVNNG